MFEMSVFLSALAAFFAIMNPLANAPLFLALTDGLTPPERRSVAIRGVLLAFAIVVVFTLCGSFIFSMFGISLPSFRITGGLLVALVGYHMLQGEQSSVHHDKSKPDEEAEATGAEPSEVWISPLAMPILAGPGTIATAMSLTAGHPWSRVLLVDLALAVICAATLLLFLGSATILRLLGEDVLKVVTRLMGLILAVIGVQMVVDGVQGVIVPAAQ